MPVQEKGIRRKQEASRIRTGKLPVRASLSCDETHLVDHSPIKAAFLYELGREIGKTKSFKRWVVRVNLAQPKEKFRFVSATKKSRFTPPFGLNINSSAKIETSEFVEREEVVGYCLPSAMIGLARGNFCALQDWIKKPWASLSSCEKTEFARRVSNLDPMEPLVIKTKFTNWAPPIRAWNWVNTERFHDECLEFFETHAGSHMWGSLGVFVIDPNAKNRSLRQAFSEWLTHWREKNPLPDPRADQKLETAMNAIACRRIAMHFKGSKLTREGEKTMLPNIDSPYAQRTDFDTARKTADRVIDDWCKFLDSVQPERPQICAD